MGYTLSGGDATLGEAPLEATVTMTLKAPPNKDATAHPHYATFYMVSWIIPGGVKQWAGVTFPSQDAKTLNQPDKLAISPIWEVGTYQGGFIPDGQIDPSQIKGSVNANTISITFPYGRHAGPLVEPLSSQATTFVLTTGGAPSPGRISGTAILGLDGLKPITGSPDSGAIFMSSRFGGEGGPAFCGDGALATHVPCVTDPAQETVPPAGALTCLPNKIPNYFARIEGKDRLNDSNASAVTLFADAPRRLVFEAMNMPTCDNTHPDLVAFDADSYAQVAAACLPFSASAQGPHVVDTADGLLFVTTNNSVPAQIVVIRERDLALLTTIDITKAPYGAPDQPLGMGWNDQTHELTVIANGSTVAGINTPDAGITLLDLIVTLDGDHVQASPAWPALSLLRAGCTNPGYAGLSSDNPYRETRHQGILVPCAWQRQGSDPQSDKDQIVQIALDTTDTTGKPCDPSYASKLCPHGFSATALPGRDRNGQTAWLYDSGSDRAFAKFDSTAGITVTAYDPDAYGPGKGGFLGRTALGLFDNAFSFGVDSATGRLYGLSPSSGITVMDGRVAKLEPGQQFHQFTAPTAQELLAVLPPTPKHPFTRVLVPFLSGAADAKTCSSAGGCRLLNWTALADTTALAQNPDANLVDLLTDNSPIKPGDQVFTSYTADARGYGVHSDLVAVGTGLANQGFGTGGSSLPFGAGNRDLLGAVVDGLNISNGLASGNASALRPADIGTAPTYLTCTEATSIQTCLPPPPGCAPPPGAPPDFCPAPPPPPPSCDPKTQQCPPPTGQLWPYPDVACDSSPNSPGQPDHQQGGTAGFYGTTWTQSKDAKGNVVNTPTQTSVAGSDNTAKAAVNCVTSDPIPGSASGQAQLQGFDLTSPGSPVHPGPQLPGFSIGKAYSITSVAPAIDPVAPYTDWQGPLSRASSSAQGIRIDLFDGSSLSIGYVNHMASATATGRTGGASSTNIVQLGKVVLTGPGPTPYDAPNVHEICGDPCPSIQAAIDQINGLLPTVLHVSQPQANAPWSTVQDPKAKNYGSPNGSPGGYTAYVQADLPHQYTDQQFNGMTPPESTYLPALRIELYNDGQSGLSREILDLAGVNVAAGVAVSLQHPAPSPSPTGPPGPLPSPVPFHCVYASPSPTATPSPSPSTSGGEQTSAARPNAVAGPEASPTPTPTPTSAADCKQVIVVKGKPPIPGKPPTPPRPGHPAVHRLVQAPTVHHAPPPPPLSYRLASSKNPIAAAAGQILAATPGGGAVGNFLEKLFNGFGIHWREFKVLISMLSFLLVLVTPLILMMRRQLWLSDAAQAA